MLIISKKDFPKDFNALGLKRGDVIQIEVGESTPDYITVDPATLKLTMVRDVTEPRESIVKEKKPKMADTLASMPLPDLKTMIQNPVSAPAPTALPPTPPIK